MAKMIGDLLEREAFGQQARGTGVTKGMRAIARQNDPELAAPAAYHRTKAGHPQGPERSSLGEEYFAPRALWSAFAQISHDGFSHGCRQWITLCLALLRASDPDYLLLPIDILQAQLAHFSVAKSIDSEKHEHGMIANVDWSVP
jgi:hypothetical protein